MSAFDDHAQTLHNSDVTESFLWDGSALSRTDTTIVDYASTLLRLVGAINGQDAAAFQVLVGSNLSSDIATNIASDLPVAADPVGCDWSPGLEGHTCLITTPGGFLLQVTIDRVGFADFKVSEFSNPGFGE
ncbi:MAG TPA: hypothetical protein PKE56_04195 [Acidimicrobiales bacterium]|nr:hypothetical protein [Acidimicrobiales bacterium]